MQDVFVIDFGSLKKLVRIKFILTDSQDEKKRLLIVKIKITKNLFYNINQKNYVLR